MEYLSQIEDDLRSLGLEVSKKKYPDVMDSIEQVTMMMVDDVDDDDDDDDDNSTI